MNRSGDFPSLSGSNRLLSVDSPKRIFKRRRRQSESGQIVVEYVLILMVAVSIAVIVTRIMVGRSDTEPGFVIQAWSTMLEQIGMDHADDISRQK